MLFVDSSRDISKKMLRIDLFDFFILVKKSKLCYNKKEKHKEKEKLKNE